MSLTFSHSNSKMGLVRTQNFVNSLKEKSGEPAYLKNDEDEKHEEDEASEEDESAVESHLSSPENERTEPKALGNSDVTPEAAPTFLLGMKIRVGEFIRGSEEIVLSHQLVQAVSR